MTLASPLKQKISYYYFWALEGNRTNRENIWRCYWMGFVCLCMRTGGRRGERERKRIYDCNVLHNETLKFVLKNALSREKEKVSILCSIGICIHCVYLVIIILIVSLFFCRWFEFMGVYCRDHIPQLWYATMWLTESRKLLF